jgi:8-oxo-dGTP pyrophosphatase MutT (NUDIX family)
MTLLSRGSVVVRMRAPRAPLAAEEQRSIDDLWQAACASASLHDGGIVSVESWARTASGVEISVEPVPYRWWVAQRRGHSGLRVRPLAVCGISVDATGRVLIGRRRSGMNYSGRWELVPSGSCELQEDGTIDPLADALRELKEEAGLEASSAELVGLTEDTAVGVFEALVLLRVSRGFVTPVGAEHESLLFIEPRQLMRYDPIPPAAEAAVILFDNS